MHTKVKSQKLEVVRVESSRIQILNSKTMTMFFGICFLFFGIATYAQCAMCRAALTNDANIKQAEAVNDGIVYLMVIPYLLVALVGYFVYKMRKTKSKTE
ncbi:hypothetical protein [Flavobacterium flavipallidum]|uniref:Uncharacterized protein n=1 Tax=Flavobacterium flavipallidum TaxID=3139140 RepID=A0ABU9HHV4_9FLAO